MIERLKIIRDIQPDPGSEKIYSLLGYKEGKRISKKLQIDIQDSIESVSKLLQPQILYTQRPIKKIDEETVKLEGTKSFRSKGLVRALKQCKRAVVFLSTIGSRLDKEIKALMGEKRMVQACIFDTIGSIAIEDTVDKFQKRMDQELKSKNQMTSYRFSPGYCDWKIEEQKGIFKVFDHRLLDIIGIQLSESFLMSPRKSISGIFGISGQKDFCKTYSNACNFCEVRECIARRL